MLRMLRLLEIMQMGLRHWILKRACPVQVPLKHRE